MTCAEKVVEGGLNCVNDMKFGGEYGANGIVKAADIPEMAFPEVYPRGQCLRYRYDELCPTENRDLFTEDERNGDEKKQREISPFSVEGFHGLLMNQDFIEGIRALFCSFTKYRVILEKDHSISIICKLEFCVLYIEFMRKVQTAQNCPRRQMLSCERRLKKDAKENELQSSVLEQPTSLNELSSGSEVQCEKQEAYLKKRSDLLSESGVNTSDEPGVKTDDKLESGMQYEEIDKSKKPDTADTESQKKEKPKFAEPVHVTTDKCNFKLLQCPLMNWCIFLLLFTKVCALGAVMKDTAYSCYDSESQGKTVQDLEKETVCHIIYLTSSTCDAPADATCPTSDHSFDLWVNGHCQYKCGVREKVVCLNTDEGMRFVCFPQDISCPKGFGWRISSNESNGFLEIILGQCQDGFYQEEKSKCHDACKDEHFSPDHIPDGLRLYRKGDSSHPQLLMCDYTMGYYNPDNKTSIRADSQLQFTIGGFCVDSPNPCSGEQMPLHNGTCVKHCKDGFERDPTDFICKQKNAKRNGSTVTPKQPPALTSTARYDPPYTVQDSKPVPSTDKTKNITNKVDDEKTTLEKFLPLVILAILGVIFVVAGLGFLIFCVYLKNKKKNTSIRTLNENGNFNLDVRDIKTLNVYYERIATDERLLNLNAVSASLDGAEELSQEASSTPGTRL